MMAAFRRKGIRRCLVVVAVSILCLAPDLLGQPVQEGKWKVTTADSTKVFYFNLSGAAQKILVTVCSTSGGVVNFGASFTAALLDPPDCFTTSGPLPAAGQLFVSLRTGTSATGTYQMTVLP